MKLTQTITSLLFGLSEVETAENAQLLIGDGTNLRNNLLKLYRATENSESQALIIDIMSEAGYPWFAKLANANKTAEHECVQLASSNDDYVMDDCIMSEEEFMELIPANGHFH